MFIQNIVDWVVESAVTQAEYWNWVSWTDPHPDALIDEPKPTFEEFMASNYIPQTIKKRKRSETSTLSIKLPKSTEWEDVWVGKDTVSLSSTEKYCGSPYFRTVPIVCKGQYCFGCIQNNC